VADDAQLVVPQVVDELTTQRVLAMDYLDGIPLEHLRADEVPQALRNRLGELLYRLLFRELFEFRFLQSDPNFANYVYLPATGQLGLLDFGGCRTIAAERAAQYHRLLRSAGANDFAATRREVCRIGFAQVADAPERADAFARLFVIGCEPFRKRGAYDFAASDMPLRARDTALEFASKGLLRPPPPDTVFLQRKLAGMFLLCARLRARVDVCTLLNTARIDDP
jgi:predicted unusual protein kinase regulating ubiquinone biosynthesis (AarF/ABC1/UbiB family)